MFAYISDSRTHQSSKNEYEHLKQHQISHSTQFDRYPLIYNLVAEISNGKTEQLKILSFGCSTGREALALALKYFPTSMIFGVDIDDDTLETARDYTSSVADRVVFYNGMKNSSYDFGPYDIIFANSVLTLYPLPPGASHATHYPFDGFNEIMAEFDNMLKPGGIFVAVNTNYRIGDTLVGQRYLPVQHNDHSTAGCNSFVPLLDRNSQPVQRDTQDDPCVFIKSS